MPCHNVLAFDFGAKRIGLAAASLSARLPVAVGVIHQSASVMDDIKKAVEFHNAKLLVVGLPRNLAGEETAQSRSVRQFAKQLETKLNLPVYLQDESVTSKQAEAELKRRNVEYNKEHVDSLAAVYILEDFLRAHPEVR